MLRVGHRSDRLAVRLASVGDSRLRLCELLLGLREVAGHSRVRGADGEDLAENRVAGLLSSGHREGLTCGELFVCGSRLSDADAQDLGNASRLLMTSR